MYHWENFKGVIVSFIYVFITIQVKCKKDPEIPKMEGTSPEGVYYYYYYNPPSIGDWVNEVRKEEKLDPVKYIETKNLTTQEQLQKISPAHYMLIKTLRSGKTSTKSIDGGLYYHATKMIKYEKNERIKENQKTPKLWSNSHDAIDNVLEEIFTCKVANAEEFLKPCIIKPDISGIEVLLVKMEEPKDGWYLIFIGIDIYSTAHNYINAERLSIPQNDLCITQVDDIDLENGHKNLTDKAKEIAQFLTSTLANPNVPIDIEGCDIYDFDIANPPESEQFINEDVKSRAIFQVVKQNIELFKDAELGFYGLYCQVVTNRKEKKAIIFRVVCVLRKNKFKAYLNLDKWRRANNLLDVNFNQEYDEGAQAELKRIMETKSEKYVNLKQSQNVMIVPNPDNHSVTTIIGKVNARSLAFHSAAYVDILKVVLENRGEDVDEARHQLLQSDITSIGLAIKGTMIFSEVIKSPPPDEEPVQDRSFVIGIMLTKNGTIDKKLQEINKPLEKEKLRHMRNKPKSAYDAHWYKDALDLINKHRKHKLHKFYNPWSSRDSPKPNKILMKRVQGEDIKSALLNAVMEYLGNSNSPTPKEPNELSEILNPNYTSINFMVCELINGWHVELHLYNSTPKSDMKTAIGAKLTSIKTAALTTIAANSFKKGLKQSKRLPLTPP